MQLKERVYVITDRKAAGNNFFPIIEALIANGFTFIQLREKDLSAFELYLLGKKIIEMGRGTELKLVVNDRLDVALALKAYGVQLTENSLTADVVKKLSKDIKIGVSIHDERRLKLFEAFADFFVFGNVFETKSKPNVVGKGVFALKNIVSKTDKPVYAIGGINADNLHLAFEAGAYGVAIKGAFFSSENYLEQIKNIKNYIVALKRSS